MAIYWGYSICYRSVVLSGIVERDVEKREREQVEAVEMVELGAKC